MESLIPAAFTGLHKDNVIGRLRIQINFGYRYMTLISFMYTTLQLKRYDYVFW